MYEVSFNCFRECGKKINLIYLFFGSWKLLNIFFYIVYNFELILYSFPILISLNNLSFKRFFMRFAFMNLIKI